MHTTTSPILPAIAGAYPVPAAAPQRASAAPTADARPFSQALSRELEQHRAAAAARPQGAGTAKEVAGVPAKAGDDTLTDTAAAADVAEAEAAAATAIAPLTDMLALVASFNLPAAAVATQAAMQVITPRAAQAGDLPAGDVKQASEAALPFAMAIAVATAAPDAQATQPTPPTQPTLVLPAAPADSAVRIVAQKPDADGGVAPAAGARSDAAPARARDAVTEVAAFRELAAAVQVDAPVPQASLAMAQAMAIAAAPADKIAARVGTPGWDNQVGQKILWMVAGKEQTALLTLNPPDMGPMQVVLSVTNDQATVTFTAAQPEVRQALEAALPKLREMMGESGIALGNATVGAGTPDGRQARHGEHAHGQPGGTRFASSGADAAPISLAPPREGRSGGASGMVDTFA